MWHEIAAYPLFFERGCGSHVTATYEWTPTKGAIRVINECTLKKDPSLLDRIVGSSCPSSPPHGSHGSICSSGKAVPEKGTILKKDTSGHTILSPGKLTVSFFPLTGAPYWVIELGPVEAGLYQWAVVSHPKRSFLWILSRAPTMEPLVLEDIYQRLVKKHGFHLDSLKKLLIFRRPS